MSFTAAVVQFHIRHLQPDTNIKRAEYFIRQAVKAKAQVVVFPEDFLTGSIFGDTRYLDRNGSYEKVFQHFAKQYKIDIVAGSWMEEFEGRAYSRSRYINAEGEVLGTYSKNHLYISERHFLTPGKDVAVFDSAYGRAGIIICWDILFSEIFARMKELGVQIVYCPSYWYREIAGNGLTYNPSAEEDHLDALCRARALEYTIIFVYANAAGVMTCADGSADHLVGHSQVTMPIVGPLAKLDHAREEMTIQTIDTSILGVAEKTYILHTKE